MSDAAPSFGIPDRQQPFVDPRSGILTEGWARFLVRIQQLTAERPVMPVAPGPSPWTFSATTIGDILVRGGTVASVTLVRGADAVDCPVSGFIPMAAQDSVTITYSVTPFVTFVPRARA